MFTSVIKWPTIMTAMHIFMVSARTQSKVMRAPVDTYFLKAGQTCAVDSLSSANQIRKNVIIRSLFTKTFSKRITHAMVIR